MSNWMKQCVALIVGAGIGAMGYFVIEKIRHPFGKIRAPKFVLLEDEL